MQINKHGVRRRALGLWACLAAITAMGCGDDDGTPDSGALDSGALDSGALDGGALDSGMLDSAALDTGELDAGAPDSGLTEVPITGFVVDVVTREMVEGTEVCVFEHAEVPCDTTDAEGVFELSAAVRGSVALTLITPEYRRMLIHLEVSDDGGSFPGAPTIQEIHANGLRAASGVEADDTKGGIATGVALADFSGPAVGATVSASPSSGVGPVYARGGIPDLDAEHVADGQLYFLNMDPGLVTLTYSWPGGDCSRRIGASWPSSDPTRDDQTLVRIEPDFLSILGTATCTPAETEVAVTGFAVDIVTRETVPGAEVCVFEHPEVPCDTTDAEGNFALSAAVRGPIALTMTKEDYANILLHIEVTDEGAAFNGAPTVQTIHAGGLSAVAGAGAPDPTKGSHSSTILLSDRSGPAVGATVSASPVSGVGPVYSSGGAPDPSVESVVDGQYFFLKTDPGEVTLTFAWPGGTCSRAAGLSWPSADPARDDQVLLRIVPDFISIMGPGFCTPGGT